MRSMGRRLGSFRRVLTRWRAETDKTGRYTVTPIRQDVREAIELYLRKNPRVGDVPLFPRPKDDSKPIRRDLAARWLLNAEKLAELPKLSGGQFTPVPQAVGDRAQESAGTGRCSGGRMEDGGNGPAALSTSRRSNHTGGCRGRKMTQARPSPDAIEMQSLFQDLGFIN